MLKVAGSTVGRIFSKEPKNKMRLAALARYVTGENNPMFGLSHSEDTRAIMSDNKQGHLVSSETKAKLSAALSRYKYPLFSKERT